MVHSIYYGIFEVLALRSQNNAFIYRGVNLKAFSLTPARPGVIVTFFNYNGNTNIYYSQRIAIVRNLEESARVMTQTPNILANSGRIVSYAYQEIPLEVFQGLNVDNLNILINGPNLITPAGPLQQVGTMVNVIALLNRWIELNFTPHIQPIEFVDNHPPSFPPRPSESYDSEGGGSGISNDLELAFYQKNPNGNYYLEQRKQINGQTMPPDRGLLEFFHEGTQVVKDAANGVKITGVNIWNKAKSIFSRGKEAASSKTSAAIVKVEKEGNTVVKAGESVVTTVKNDGKAVVKAGESVVTSVKNNGNAVVKAGESVVTSVKNDGKAVINAGETAVDTVKKEASIVVKTGETAVDTVKKEASIIVKTGETVKKEASIIVKTGETAVDTVKKEASIFVKTGETVIDTTRKDGAAFIAQGAAAIAEVERDGGQIARGAEEMGEVAGEVIGEMGRVTAGRVIVDVLEIV
ncbi:hypothetical protein ACTFIZ_001263 [Dictyostelium cf. discoideum]